MMLLKRYDIACLYGLLLERSFFRPTPLYSVFIVFTLFRVVFERPHSYIERFYRYYNRLVCVCPC